MTIDTQSAPRITEDEIARRRRELEPMLYRKHGVLILHRDDADLIGMDRLLFDALARRRFGKGVKAA